MERLEEYGEEESPYTKQDNLQIEPIHEDITTNSLELLQTIKELKSEMESVKKENERILKAQEELNQILIEIFHIEGRGKRVELEDISYHISVKRLNRLKMKAAHLSKCLVIDVILILLVTVVRITTTLEKENINLMNKFLESLRRSNRQYLMEKLKRGSEQNPGYPG